MGFKESVLNKEVKLYPLDDGKYRIYGKTFEIKDELKELGATWNNDRRVFEISNDNFSKLPLNVRQMILKIILQSKVDSLKIISDLIIEDKIKLFLKDGNYRVYGKTKEIYSHLLNIGFKLIDGKYQLKEESFNKEFKEEVKEKIKLLSNTNHQIKTEEMEV